MSEDRHQSKDDKHRERGRERKGLRKKENERMKRNMCTI